MVTDHELFVHVKNGRLVFAVAVHVDDFRYGGSPSEVTRFETAPSEASYLGPDAVGTLTFTGLRIVTVTDTSSSTVTISVDQEHYLALIEPLLVSPTRAASRSAVFTTMDVAMYRQAAPSWGRPA